MSSICVLQQLPARIKTFRPVKPSFEDGCVMTTQSPSKITEELEQFPKKRDSRPHLIWVGLAISVPFEVQVESGGIFLSVSIPRRLDKRLVSLQENSLS